MALQPAERDIQKGLSSYFVESESFRRVIENEKFILLGNRGAGKSAIFKILAERMRAQGAIIIELSPDNYSYELLSQVLASEKHGSWAKQGAFTAAWKYLIYLTVMKELTSQGKKLKTGASARIYNYLRDNHKGFQDNPISVLISYLKRIESFKIGPIDASIKTKQLNSLYKLEEILRFRDDLFELCAKKRVFVLIDELDKGWDSSDEAKAFVAGLFSAAVSLNEDPKNFRVLVSLRRELYDSIPAIYEDAQKYRDVLELITWDEESLLSLVAKRIRYGIDRLDGRSDIECWNTVFAEILDYRKNKSFNYVVDRTLYRPREVIQFCSDALDKAREQNLAVIDYDIISRAESLYSEGRARDLAAEYRFQYPGLLSIFEVLRGKSYNLEREALELICLSITTGEIPVDREAAWAIDQDPDLLIDVLWRVGFLRAQAVGGLKALRRSGSQYLGPHQISNLNLRTIQRFHVHPMFRSFLGLKEAKETREAGKED